MDSNMKLYSLILFTCNLTICWCGVIKSSTDTFQTIEQATITDQSNIFRPDLGCILFGAAGCSITCNVMCDMYACQSSNPICLDEIYCECNEKYEITSSLTATTSDYNRLSFNKLWNYKLNKSKTSKKIRQKIFQDPETFDEILKILRDPHKTGLHVIRRLQDLHPKWTSVSELEPRQLGYINKLIEGEQLNGNELNEYLETNMEPLIEETYDQLQNVEHEARLGDVLDQISREDEIRQIMEQIALLNKDSLNDYTKNRLKQKGFEVDNLTEMLNKKNSGLVSVYDTDQLILASVLEKLLDVKDQANNRIGDVESTQAKRTKQFALSEEMTVGREDLFDLNFNADEDLYDAKSFILSEEMTVGREDLYDSDFARSIQSSESESKSRKNKRKYKGNQSQSQKFDRYEINKSNRISNRKINNNNNNNNNNNDEYQSPGSINNNNNDYLSYYDDNYTAGPAYPPPPLYSNYYNPGPAYSSFYGNGNNYRQGPAQYQMNSNFGGSLPPMPPPPPPPPANICCGGYSNFAFAGPPMPPTPPPPPPPQSWDADCCDDDRSRRWMENFFN